MNRKDILWELGGIVLVCLPVIAFLVTVYYYAKALGI